MAQPKRTISIEQPNRGPKAGTGYAGRGGAKREIKARLPQDLADRFNQERAEYDNMSVAHYLIGVLNAFYEAKLEPKWTKRRAR